MNNKLIIDLKKWYFQKTKINLDLNCPKTFNDKMQWLKIYNAIPLKTLLADKYLVRDWIKERIGEQYLVPLLGVYDKFEDIDFNKLPNQFVIKCNHGSGYNIIITNKLNINLVEIKNKLNRWMATDFAFRNGFELHYSNIKPKIIIEEYLNPIKSNHEVQVWCFNKNIKFISIESIKDSDNLVRGTFYPDGTPTEFKISPNHYNDLNIIPNKNIFNKAIKLAQRLQVDVPFVRIDFVEFDGDLKFREMTFTSGSGLSKIEPAKYNKILGDCLVLPNTIYNFNTDKYYKPNIKLKKPIIYKRNKYF